MTDKETEVTQCGPFKTNGFRDPFDHRPGHKRPAYCGGMWFQPAEAGPLGGVRLDLFTINGNLLTDEMEAVVRIVHEFFQHLDPMDLRDIVLGAYTLRSGGIGVLQELIDTAIARGWRGDKPHVKIHFDKGDLLFRRMVLKFVPELKKVFADWTAEGRERAKLRALQPHAKTFTNVTLSTFFGGSMRLVLDDSQPSFRTVPEPVFRLVGYENKSTVWARHPGLKDHIRTYAQEQMRPFWSPINSIHIPRLP